MAVCMLTDFDSDTSPNKRARPVFFDIHDGDDADDADDDDEDSTKRCRHTICNEFTVLRVLFT